MPRFDVECSKCGIKGEVTAKDTRSLGQCGCGGEIEWVPSVRINVFKPFVHEHLGNKPVRIESWKQYQQELRSRNLHNELAD